MAARNFERVSVLGKTCLDLKFRPGKDCRNRAKALVRSRRPNNDRLRLGDGFGRSTIKSFVVEIR